MTDQLIPATPKLLASEPLPFRVRLRDGREDEIDARSSAGLHSSKTRLHWYHNGSYYMYLEDISLNDITHIIRAGDGEAAQPDELASLRAENKIPSHYVVSIWERDVGRLAWQATCIFNAATSDDAKTTAVKYQQTNGFGGATLLDVEAISNPAPAVIASLRAEVERLRKTLRDIASMAGAPDATQACRNIIAAVEDALRGDA